MRLSTVTYFCAKSANFHSEEGVLVANSFVHLSLKSSELPPLCFFHRALFSQWGVGRTHKGNPMNNSC